MKSPNQLQDQVEFEVRSLMEDIKNEIMVMQRDFMTKLRDNCLYSENKGGMTRLQSLESKVEQFEDEMA